MASICPTEVNNANKGTGFCPVKESHRVKEETGTGFCCPSVKKETGFCYHPVKEETGFSFIDHNIGKTDPRTLITKDNRDSLTRKLFFYFNLLVFDLRLPIDMEVSWCRRLQTSAGNSRMRKGKCIIHLSTKLLINFERLSDTLAHEMCHAAVFLIDKDLKTKHGPKFVKWIEFFGERLPDMPPVTLSHDYEISYNFHYTCKRCRYVDKRNRRLPLDEFVCPRCTDIFLYEKHMNKKRNYRRRKI